MQQISELESEKLSLSRQLSQLSADMDARQVDHAQAVLDERRNLTAEILRLESFERTTLETNEALGLARSELLELKESFLRLTAEEAASQMRAAMLEEELRLAKESLITIQQEKNNPIDETAAAADLERVKDELLAAKRKVLSTFFFSSFVHIHREFYRPVGLLSSICI